MPDSNVLFIFDEPEVSVRGAVPGLGAHVGTCAMLVLSLCLSSVTTWVPSLRCEHRVYPNPFRGSNVR
jgi:hypothetical protein